MQNPFDFTFAIKFVDGDPSENVFGLGNGAQTGDMMFAIIAAILALIAIGAGLLWFVRNRQAVMATARTTLGAHVTMRGVSKPKGQFALIAFAIVALALSLITFVGSGTAQAIAEGGQIGVPVVKAQVFDDGTININPISVKNNKGYDIKVRSSQWALDGEAWTDAGLQNSQLSDTALDGIVYEGNPADENIQYFVYNNEEAGGPFERIEVGETATFDLGISGLSAETANSYLDQVVYIHQITFENAEVDIRDAIDFTEFNLGETPFHEGEEFYLTYDGKWHNPLNYDFEADFETDGHTYPYYPNFDLDDEETFYNMFGQDVQLDEYDSEVPYMTPIALKPGFVFKGSDEETEADIEWYIDPAPYSIKTKNVSKDYDMYPIFWETDFYEEDNAEIYGLQTREVYPTIPLVGQPTLKEEVVPLVYDVENLGFVTHVYNSGVQNYAIPYWYAPEPKLDTQVRALENNYYIDMGACEYGVLSVNPIDFIKVPVVPFDKQVYTYNGTQQGQTLKFNFGTLEDLYYDSLPDELKTYDWNVQDFYLDPTASSDPIVYGHKSIRNVNQSGPVTYFIEEYIYPEGSSDPIIGDYNDVSDTYDLIIDPRPLNWDEVTYLGLNGMGTYDNPAGENPHSKAHYDLFWDRYNGEEIVPGFYESGGYEDPFILRWNVPEYGDYSDYPSVDDFYFDGGKVGYGWGNTKLTPKPNSNYTSELIVPFFVYALTGVDYEQGEHFVMKNANSNYENIDTALFEVWEDSWPYAVDYEYRLAYNNPIFANEDSLLFAYNLTDEGGNPTQFANPFTIKVEAQYMDRQEPEVITYNIDSPEAYEHLDFSDEYDAAFGFSVPRNENGDYAYLLNVTYESFANVTFNDMTVTAPEEEGMGTETYPLSHVEALKDGEWVSYESVAPTYTVGTTITKVAGYDNMFLAHSDGYGEDQYIRVELGAYNPEDDEEIAVYNEYVKEHYSIDADTFLPSYTVREDGTTIEYELTQADRYTVENADGARWSATEDGVTIPWVLTTARHETEAYVLEETDDVYAGTEVSVTAKQVAAGDPNVFNPAFGWSLTLLDEEGEEIDVVYAGGDNPVAKFIMPACDVTYKIEPFARLLFEESELTPGTITGVQYQTLDMEEPEPYFFGTGTIPSVWVPRGQLFGSKDGEVLDTILPYSVWYGTERLVIDKPLAVNFTVLTGDGYDFAGFNTAYMADYTEAGPSHQLFKIELGAEETHVFKFVDETHNSNVPEEQPHIPDETAVFSHIETQINSIAEGGWEPLEEDDRITAPEFKYLEKVNGHNDILKAEVDGNLHFFKIVPGIYDDGTDPSVAEYNDYINKHYSVGPDTLSQYYPVEGSSGLTYELVQQNRYKIGYTDNGFWTVPTDVPGNVTIPTALEEGTPYNISLGDSKVYPGTKVSVNNVASVPGGSDKSWQTNVGWQLVVYATVGETQVPVASAPSWDRNGAVVVPDAEELETLGVDPEVGLKLAIEPFMLLTAVDVEGSPTIQGLESLTMTVDEGEALTYPEHRLFIPRGASLSQTILDPSHILTVVSNCATVWTSDGSAAGSITKIGSEGESASHSFKFAPVAKENYNIWGWNVAISPLDSTTAEYSDAHGELHQWYNAGLITNSAAHSITWDDSSNIESVSIDGGEPISDPTLAKAAPGQTVTFTPKAGFAEYFSLKMTESDIFGSDPYYVYYEGPLDGKYTFEMPDCLSLSIGLYEDQEMVFVDDTEYLTGYVHNHPVVEFSDDEGDTWSEYFGVWEPYASDITVEDNVITVEWLMRDGVHTHMFRVVNNDGAYKFGGFDDVVIGEDIHYSLELKTSQYDYHKLIIEDDMDVVQSIKDVDGYEYADDNAVAKGTNLIVTLKDDVIVGEGAALGVFETGQFDSEEPRLVFPFNEAGIVDDFQMPDYNVTLKIAGVDPPSMNVATDENRVLNLRTEVLGSNENYGNENMTVDGENSFVFFDILFALDVFHLFF